MVITLTQSVNGLTPGWILLNAHRNNYWHFRESNGVVNCMRSKGAQVHVHQWSKEPKGRNEVCPVCRKSSMRVVEKEPEVLAPPEAQPANAEKSETETALVANPQTNKRITLKEAAELIDVKYMTMYHWAAGANSKLHYDVKTCTIPESDLTIIESLAEHRKAYLAKRGIVVAEGNKLVRTKAKPEALPPIGIGPTVADTSSYGQPYGVACSFHLTPKQVFIAKTLGKTPNDFVKWCVDEACASLVAKLVEAGR